MLIYDKGAIISRRGIDNGEDHNDVASFLKFSNHVKLF